MSSAEDDTGPTFESLGLAAPVLAAVTQLGYEAPTPIQARAIPPLLAGRDLLGQAQTGTGKTAAFALPALSRLDPAQRVPQVLVLTPTRELAIQVAEAMQTYGRGLEGFHVLPVYGGQSLGLQIRHLKRGVQVVVGTPGRVLDHLGRGTLDLGNLRTAVLDEVDEMLRMGFLEDVEAIFGHMPAERQVALFSATIPKAIRSVAKRQMRDPIEVSIETATVTVATVRQRYFRVAPAQKLEALTRILEAEELDGMLVFVRTRVATAELADRLEARGFAAAPLSGEMNQPMRERTVERLRSGALEIVVATDVAARGLDVDRISHVVNFDMPYDPEAYVHRIGRTGRAGNTGEAILFVEPREMRMLRSIERATRQKIEPANVPTQAAVTDRRIARFKATIDATLEAEELEAFDALVTGYAAERDVPMERVAAALAHLAQQDRPLGLDVADEEEELTESGEGGRPRRSARPDDGEVIFDRYRVEVGRNHGVEPKHLVGAISNEAGLDGRHIGRIRIFPNFSIVELPEGMPSAVFRHLCTVRVRGRELRLSLDRGPDGDRPGGRGRGPTGPGPGATRGARGRPRERRERPTRSGRGRRPRDKDRPDGGSNDG